MDNKLWVWIGLGGAAVLGALYVSGVIDPKHSEISAPPVTPAATDAAQAPAAETQAAVGTAPKTQADAGAPAGDTAAESLTATGEPAAGDGAEPEIAATEPVESPEAPAQEATGETSEIALAVPAEGATAAETDLAMEEADAGAPRDGATDTAPSFDLVRAEPGGLVTVAGRAAPGSQVVLLLDGREELTSTAGSDGRFAAFFDLPASDEPQVLRLRMQQDGQQVESEQEVILTPPAVPQVAQDAGEAADTALAAAGAGDTGGVTAEAAPTVLLSDAEGIAVMQGSASVAPGSVSIDAITYDDTGGVALSGRGSGEAFLRVYLDNSEITTQQVAADGRWQVALPQIEAGTYTLRVDQIDAGGKVTARAESPFRREPPEKLAAAAAELPSAEEVTAVTVQPGNTLWAIARERYGDGMSYVRLFEANKTQIRNPDLIYPGQIFAFPD